MDEHAEWDERYAESDRVWSGQPNGALIAEVAGMPPGRVLDVGCGEGADVIWLAQQGWTVTALDVSTVALARARDHASEAGVKVNFVLSGLLDAGLERGTFDLVAALYPALRHTDEHDTEGLLLDLVAPGGTLLFVHHALDHEHDHSGHGHGQGQNEHGDHHGGHTEADGTRFDPADYVSVADVSARLDAAWTVDVNEERDRTISGGGGARHVRDLIVRAHRVTTSRGSNAQPDHELDILEDDQNVPPRPEEEVADAAR